MNALGSKLCIVLGCRRERATSADGRIRYAHCVDHALAFLRAATA